MHYLLTKVEYTDIAGLSFVEWDALFISDYFLENWYIYSNFSIFYNSYLYMYIHICIKFFFILLFYSRLYEPLFLQRISCHQITGESLPLNMIDKLKNAKTHLSGYNLCKELYLSQFDLELYSR